MKVINRQELKEQLSATEQIKVIEVLAPEAFHEFHIPGAINIPLGEEFEHRVQEVLPDKDNPVVVYCQDERCTASRQAAETMERLGYHNVIMYPDGKRDWREAGMPVET